MLKYSDGTSHNEPLICKLHSQHLGIGDTRKHIDGFKHKLFYRVEMYTYLIGVMDQYELATLVQNSRMIYFFYMWGTLGDVYHYDMTNKCQTVTMKCLIE